MTKLFKITAAFGSALLVLYMCSPKSRPEQSELALAAYDDQCTGGNLYDVNCKGKYVTWEGIVQDVETDNIRVELTDSLMVDVQDVETRELSLIEGQKVRLSGWLADENLNPDVAEGVIEPLESSTDAKGRVAAEAAREAAQREREARALLAAEADAAIAAIAAADAALDAAAPVERASEAVESAAR